MPDTRLLSLTSPLGPDKLLPVRLGVIERVDQPYTIDVEVVSTDVGVLPSKLLTQGITVTVRQPRSDGGPLLRHFHGLVASFEVLGPGPGGTMRYRLVAVPGLWRLGLRQHCRIFQDKSVKDIVQAVLAEHGQPVPKWGILPALQPMPYCTQFNETDLAFVSRLLEEHGLSYHHVHADGSHTLCITSTAPGFPMFEGGDVRAMHGAPELEDLDGWSRANHARIALFDLVDMDGERSQPSVTLAQRSETRTLDGEPAMWKAGQVHHWPGGMSTRPGVQRAAISMGAEEAASEHYRATARDPRFSAGMRANIAVRDEQGSMAGKLYLVTAVEHQAQDPSGLFAGAGGTPNYTSSLRLVSAARPWMPEARHPRPMMAGLYSATVTGPQGEQIHVDAVGRIKVRFRWDTTGPSTDGSSCWIRVAQAAAGAWGGTWFLPRVGDEVLVAFLDGDPDRPVVTASVYGKDAKPPFDPGANRSQSGISTRSYKSESAADSNKLRFEDKKGKEEVLLHAQKDLAVEVENNEKRDVGHDQTTTVKNARTTTIKDADDKLTLDKGSGTHTYKMGDLTIKCELGQITLEAMQKITLKVGQSTVVLEQSGITLKGMMITSEAQLLNKAKGVMVEQKGDAMVQVQGGIVMIN